MEGLAGVIGGLNLLLKSKQNFEINNNIEVEINNNKLVRQKPDRFLVNIYEKVPENKDTRTLNRLVNKPTMLNLEKNKRPIRDKIDKNIFRNNTDYFLQLYKKETMDQFLQLKSRRDMECLKMKEASNALQLLRKYSPHEHWFEKILAEKVLLKSGKAVELLTNKIREDYVYIKEKNVQIGTVSVSNFKFHLGKQPVKSKETNFYVMLLCNELDVKISNVARSVGGDIAFDEEFKFTITKNFAIKVQLFSIVMKEAPNYFTLTKLLPCNKSTNNLFSKLQYKNLNTSDFVEADVLKSTFKLCAETEVTASNIHNKAWKLNLAPNSQLHDYACFSTKIESFKICKKRSGFLTFGCNKKNQIVWNRRWCCLEGNLMKVYNSPSEEDFVSPMLTLDLKNCSSNKIEVAPPNLCNRSKSLMLSIKESDVVCNYFFMADSSFELRSWIAEFNLILDLLRFKNYFKL